MIEVELLALAVYAWVVAPWQRIEVKPIVNTGEPTVGVTVTVCVDDLGPLQPAADAVMTEAPLNPGA